MNENKLKIVLQYINKSIVFTNYLSKYNEGIKHWIVKEVRESNENGYLGAIYVNEKTKKIIDYTQ